MAKKKRRRRRVHESNSSACAGSNTRPRAPLHPTKPTSPTRLFLRIFSRAGRIVWGALIAVSVPLGVWVAVSQVLPRITVEPSVSYDESDPFSQRFTITNNGMIPIYDVHYICAVTHVETDNLQFTDETNRVITVMVPIAQFISKLDAMERTGTDCDFILKFGQEIQSANIAIYVFYKIPLFPLEIRTSSYRFSSKRFANHRFVWEFGSNDVGPLDPGSAGSDKRDVFVVPFIGSSQTAVSVLKSPEESEQFILRLFSTSHKVGRKVIASTLLPPNVYLRVPAVTSRYLWPHF